MHGIFTLLFCPCVLTMSNSAGSFLVSNFRVPLSVTPPPSTVYFSPSMVRTTDSSSLLESSPLVLAFSAIHAPSSFLGSFFSCFLSSAMAKPTNSSEASRTRSMGGTLTE